ncbi:MAG: hypothetical protein COB85_06080, partial [Bacteroidetes bacterium]
MIKLPGITVFLKLHRHIRILNIGDILLKEIANRLETICRETDYIARLSGDEFCIL